jgi:hypothetical protein
VSGSTLQRTDADDDVIVINYPSADERRMKEKQEQEAKPQRTGRSKMTMAVVAIVVIAGLLERWILLKHSSLQPDSDESMSGLMAMNLLKGNSETFLWGQPYGGAAEIWPVALMIKIFGPNLFAMRAVTVALGAVAPFLMWRVASRLLSKHGAIAAALTMWIWPVALISWSMREFLYYEPVLVLGLTAILLTQRFTENTSRWHHMTAAGFCLGIGFWMSPFVSYFGIFVVLTLIQAKKEAITKGWSVAVGFIVGLIPWLSYNIPREFISLQTPDGATGGSYTAHLDYLAHPGMAVALGIKGWYSKAYPFDSNMLGRGLLVACLAIGAFVIVRAFVKWGQKQDKFPVDMACLLAWPFLYALSPMTGSHELWVPRYFFFLWPFMAFVIGRMVQSRRSLPVAIACVLALSGMALNDQTKRVNDWPYTGQLRQQAAANGVTHMFTSYWVAYKITYETQEKLIATPAFGPSVRYEPYDIMVRQSTNPAWAFRHGDKREARFLEATRKMGMNLTPIRAGAYDLFVLDRMLLPEDLPADVHIDPIEGV